MKKCQRNNFEQQKLQNKYQIVFSINYCETNLTFFLMLMEQFGSRTIVLNIAINHTMAKKCNKKQVPKKCYKDAKETNFSKQNQHKSKFVLEINGCDKNQKRSYFEKLTEQFGSRTIVLQISIFNILPKKCKQKWVRSKKVLEKNAKETNFSHKNC